jgi:hypothetical protein
MARDVIGQDAARRNACRPIAQRAHELPVSDVGRARR